MSRFGMGFGKDDMKHTQHYRPCVRVHSSRCQQVLNKWFSGKDDKGHPDWMTTEFASPPREFASDKGDWQLVWHARSRPNTVTVPTRKVLHTLKDEDEKNRLKARLAHELGGAESTNPMNRSNARDTQNMERDQLASQMSSRRGTLSRGSKRAISTAGSILKSERERPASSLSELREGDVNLIADDRLGTSYSRASRVSKASRRSQSSMVSSSLN